MLEQEFADISAQTASMLSHLESKADDHKDQLETVVKEAQLSIEASLEHRTNQVATTTASNNTQLLALLQRESSKHNRNRKTQH